MIGLLIAAGIFSANQLYNVCQKEPSPGVCISYFAGSMDAIAVMQDIGGKRYVCLPDGVARDQATDIVKKFLTENPARRNLPAGMVVLLALQEAYPCSNRGGSRG